MWLRFTGSTTGLILGSVVPRNYFQGVGLSPGIFSWGVSTNSVEDRGHRELRFGGGSRLVRGSNQFANE
jgi:hypothetical protein